MSKEEQNRGVGIVEDKSKEEIGKSTFLSELRRKSKLSRSMKILTSILVLVGVISIFLALVMNAHISNVLEQRDTRLDIYEDIKYTVMGEVIGYLTIKDIDSYNFVKENSATDRFFSNALYGETYQEGRFLGADKVTFVDVQYTLEGESVVYYLLLNTHHGNEGIRELNALVFYKEGVIFDMLFY